MDAIPFQAARAQFANVQALGRVQPAPAVKTFVLPVQPVAPVQGQPTNQTTSQPAGTPASVSQALSQASLNRAKIASRLVAAVVPGGVSFAASASPSDVRGLSSGTASGASARVATPQPTLPLYRHPADKNIAATGVQAGRVIDVVG
jgi:hypothetical protein